MLRDEKNRIDERELEEQNLTGENPGSIAANTPVKVLTASSVIGDEVRNLEDKHVGNIHDVMLNLTTGCIEYFILEFGGFLGFGEKLFAIPFNSLMLNSKEHNFILNVDKDILEKAPGFDVEHWPETNSDHWKDVDGYWDIKKQEFHKKFIK